MVAFRCDTILKTAIIKPVDIIRSRAENGDGKNFLKVGNLPVALNRLGREAVLMSSNEKAGGSKSHFGVHQ